MFTHSTGAVHKNIKARLGKCRSEQGSKLQINGPTKWYPRIVDCVCMNTIFSTLNPTIRGCRLLL